MQIARLLLPLSLGLALLAPVGAALANEAGLPDSGPGQMKACQKCRGHQARKEAWKNMTPEQREAKRAEMKERFAKELGLSAEQQEQIEAIRQAFHESHKDQFEAMKAKKQELRQLKESGASQEEIQARREAIKQEFASLRTEREQLMAQIKAVLTPEQAARLEAKKAEHQKNREQRGKHHRGPESEAPADAPAPEDVQ